MTRRFNQTEIDMIPEDWGEKFLGDCIELVYGEGLPKRKRINGNIPVYGSNGIIGFHDKFLVEGPGIIVGRKGSVGEVAFSKNNYWPIDTTYYVRMKGDNDILFWYYFLRTLNLSQMNTHSAVPGLNRDLVYEIVRSIPPFLEQRAIAKIFSDLDEKIEFNRQMNRTLESIAQAIFKHWFIDFEFPDEEGKPYRSSGSEMVDSELGEIPKAWKVNKIKDVVADRKYAIVDGPFGTQLHSDEYVSEGVPVIRITNLTYEGRFISKGLVFITEDKFNSLKRSAVYPGDILLAKTGATIGKLSMMPGYIEKALIASSILKISPNQNNRYYLYNIIRNLSNKNYWDKISAGSTRSTVNLIDIKDIPIIIPDSRLLRVFENLLNNFYFIIENNEKQNQNLTQIRDSLLPNLMSGKLEIKEMLR